MAMQAQQTQTCSHGKYSCPSTREFCTAKFAFRRMLESMKDGAKRRGRTSFHRTSWPPSWLLSHRAKHPHRPPTSTKMCPARVPRSRWSGDIGGSNACSWAQAAITQSSGRDVASSGPTVGHAGDHPWTLYNVVMPTGPEHWITKLKGTCGSDRMFLDKKKTSGVLYSTLENGCTSSQLPL